ncbi:MAG: AhpC/TSA family protein [Dysgonamonadaceae bacterium]|jgi:peroxiredoxin|nr:AhpC/TSA family protein [Dysgonamonadaceae bacterium]
MKKIFLLFAAVAVLFSCQKKNEYTINGTVVDPDYEGDTIYVQKIGENEFVTVDTVVIKNGSFTLKGTADSTYLRFFALSKSKPSLPVLVEPGVIKVTFDSLSSVSGTPVNDAYNTFKGEVAGLEKKISAVIKEYNRAEAEGKDTDSIEQSYDTIVEEITRLSFEFAKENIHNELGEYVFLSSAGMFKTGQQKELLDMASDKFKAMPMMQRLSKFVENAERVAEGKKFADFSMQDPSGKDVSLSDYAGKGKYVLVDFWASWCSPCRAEMPNVVEAYKKYKAKGFEVVGVSLDKDKNAWLKGIKDLNITWPQMSDLLYWKSPVVELYAFQGIPHTVLLDKEGVIIAKNLRGKALDEKLAELLK